MIKVGFVTTDSENTKADVFMAIQYTVKKNTYNY